MSSIMTVRLAFNSIASNKLRTFLTMLGVIIAVAAVITMVSIGQGATKAVTDQIKKMGTADMVTVNIWGDENKQLEYDDMDELRKIENVVGVAPIMQGGTEIRYDKKNMHVGIQGVDSYFPQVRKHYVDRGRFIVPLDMEMRQRVIILGSKVEKELFPFEDAIGKHINLNGVSYTVVGTMEEKGQAMWEDPDSAVWIPLTTAQRFFKRQGIGEVYITASSEEMVPAMTKTLETNLKDMVGEDCFDVYSQTEYLKEVEKVYGILTLVLAGIAGISLLVGGIGIMNIMLVSVTERTNEIGIRKAIGAKRRNILLQFLIEAGVISGVGGIIGIILGWGASKGIAAIISNSTGETMTAYVSPAVVLIAVGFSFIVGMFFGIYPANKAAKLKPVDALRFE